MSEPERWIVIPNWGKFQHRDAWRSRIPPWICDYTEQTGREEYLRLTLVQRGLLHGIRLEYARSRSQLSASTASLSRRLGVRQILRRDIEALNDAGFLLFSASKPARDSASNIAREDASLEEIREDTKAHTSKADAQTALQLDPEKSLELSKIIGELHGVNGTTWTTLEPLAARVPQSVLADLRTRSAGKGTGWVVRALQAEIRERGQAA